MKFFKNTDKYNGCGNKGVAIKFSLDDLKSARLFIKNFSGDIDKEYSINDEYELAKFLIKNGIYNYYRDEENGTLFEDLSEEEFNNL